MKIKSNYKLLFALQKFVYSKISLQDNSKLVQNSKKNSDFVKHYNKEIKKEPINNLSPYWVTGFTDAEGCCYYF